jgi:hypothetical protein
MRSQTVLRFGSRVFFAVVACIALNPQNAQAIEQKIPAAACNGAGGMTFQDVGGHMYNHAGGGPSTLVCPLQDNSDRNFTGMDTLDVYVYDNGPPTAGSNFRVQAQACISLYEENGTLCGNAAVSPGRGWKHLVVPDTEWTNGAHSGFGYIQVTLPTYNVEDPNEGPSKLVGISVTYP